MLKVGDVGKGVSDVKICRIIVKEKQNKTKRNTQHKL